jgi:hypothetical protein
MQPKSIDNMESLRMRDSDIILARIGFSHEDYVSLEFYNRGVHYLNHGKQDIAEAYFSDAVTYANRNLEQLTEDGIKMILSKAYNNLGVISYLRDLPNYAKGYFKSALAQDGSLEDAIRTLEICSISAPPK